MVSVTGASFSGAPVINILNFFATLNPTPRSASVKWKCALFVCFLDGWGGQIDLLKVFRWDDLQFKIIGKMAQLWSNSTLFQDIMAYVAYLHQKYTICVFAQTTVYV